MSNVLNDIPRNNYGLRNDLTQKDRGFLGEVMRPDGDVMTELSVGVNVGGKEIEIPTLVPTLSKDEIEELKSNPANSVPSSSIIDKAVKHAKGRISQGMSPFYDYRKETNDFIIGNDVPVDITNDLERANKELKGGVSSFGESRYLNNQSSSVFDIDTNRAFNVPNIFDEIDTRFAIDTQADKANKSNYIGKTFVGEDLAPDETITSIKKNDNNWIENTYKGAAISGINMYNTFRAFAESSGAAEIKQYTENQYNPSFIDKLTRYQDTKTIVAKYGIEAINKPQEEIDRKSQLSIDIMNKSKQFIKDSGLEAEGVMADIGGATVSIGASIGLTYATGNPIAAAALFGASARASAYLEAKENGKSDLEAMSVANAVGLFEGALEFLGIEKLFKVAKNSAPIARGINKIALNAVKKYGSGAAVEFIQESSQGLSEEVLMQNFGGRDKDIYQTAKDIAYQGLIGGLVGGVSSAVIGTIENQLGKSAPETIKEEEFKNISKDTIIELYQSDVGDEIINVLGKELDPSTDAYTPEEFSREVKRIDGEKRQTIIDNLIAKGYTPEQANEALDSAINKVSKINSVTQVEIDVSNKLIQAGYSVDEANKQAKVFGANAFKMGNILGIDPYTYYKEHSTFEIVKGEQVKEGDLGQDLTPQQKEFFKDTKVVDKKGEPLVVYHGGASGIETFDLKYLGKQGMSEGAGFYFTDSKDIAEGYAENRNGKLYSAFIDIKKPITSLEQKKITKSQLSKIFNILYKNDKDALSNYGDVDYDGYNNVLNNAVETEFNGAESDLDLIASIGNSGMADRQFINDTFIKVTGYDGVILKDSWIKEHGGENLIVAFSPNQIKEVSNVAPTADPNIYKQEARGFIRENETGIGYIIGLLDSDLSTFLHEGFGHLFTLELKKAGVKSPVAKKKWDTLADYYGYDENGTKQEKEDALERMSRAFESYFMEGKSPNKRLASAFETFKQWLVEIYKSFSSLRTYINPEVKAVFDTLVGGKSIDEVFTDEGTKLYAELNTNRERKFERLWSAQGDVNLIVELKGAISGAISRIKQLSDGISKLATKDKNPVINIANEFGVSRLNDIETAIKMSHMRVPAEPKKLVNVLRSKRVGGINAQWARRLGIIDKDFDKTVFVKEGGIANENDLVDVLIANDFMNKTAAETYGETSAQWDEALNLLENMNEVSTDINKSQAREIALDARNSADEYIGKIFPNKSEAEILEMIDDYKSKNNLYDKISKGAAKDIKSLMNEIDSNIKSLSRAIKKDNMQEAKDIKEIIIDLISDLPKAQRGDFIYKIKNINTAKQLTKELPEIVNKIQAILEENFTKRIYKKISRLANRMQVKKVNGHLENKMMDADLLKLIDKVNSILKSSDEEIQKDLNAWVEEASKEDYVEDKDQTFLNMIRGIKLGTASPEIFIEAYNSLAEMYEYGKISGLAHKLARQQENEELRAGATTALNKITGKLLKAVNFVNRKIDWNYSLIDFFNMLSSGEEAGKSFFNDTLDFHAAEEKMRALTIKNENIFLDLFSEINNIKGATKAQKIKSLKKYIQTLAGKTTFENVEMNQKDALGNTIIKDVVISKDEIIDIYMKMQESGSVASILDEKGNGYTEEFINKMFDTLTPEDIAFADALFEFYNSTKDDLFDKFEMDYGVRLESLANYSPRFRDLNKLSEANNSGLANLIGRLKVRKDVISPIKFGGAYNTYIKYVAETSHYLAFNDIMKKAEVIFTDRKIKEDIEKKFSEAFYDSIKDKLNNMNNRGKNVDPISRFVRSLGNHLAFSTLAGKPISFFKQMTGIFGFLEKMPVTDFFSGLSDYVMNIEKANKILNENAIIATRGGSMNVETTEILKSDFGKFSSKYKSLQEFNMFFQKWGDLVTVRAGAWAVYKYNLKQGKSHEKALLEAGRQVTETQSSNLEFDKTGFHSSPVGRLFTIFLSPTNLFLRKEVAAISGALTGRVTPQQAIKTVFIYHVLIPVLFQLLSDMGKWDWENQKKALIFGNINGLFIIGDALIYAYDKLNGESTYGQEPIKPTVLSGVNKFFKNSINLLDDIGTEEFFESLIKLSEASGEAVGLPIKQTVNSIRGIKDISEGDIKTGIQRLMGYSNYVIENQE